MRSKRSAFTLIELLIVVAMLTIMSLTTANMLVTAHTAMVQTADRQAAWEESWNLGRLWREDIARARSITIVDAQTMDIALIVENEPERIVRYALQKNGNLVRTDGALKPAIVARNVEKLAFEKVEAGYAMRWSVTRNDPPGSPPTDQVAYATPLAPLAGGPRP